MTTSGDGLVIKSWKVDFFYDRIETMPKPETPAWDTKMEHIELLTVGAFTRATELMTETLVGYGIRTVVSER